LRTALAFVLAQELLEAHAPLRAAAPGRTPNLRQLAACELERLLAHLEPLGEALDPELALQLNAVPKLLEGPARLLDGKKRVAVTRVPEDHRLDVRLVLGGGAPEQIVDVGVELARLDGHNVEAVCHASPQRAPQNPRIG
jgi:hypothetical protein